MDYEYLCSMGNLTLAWRNARKGKTHRKDVIEFEENLEKNLLDFCSLFDVYQGWQAHARWASTHSLRMKTKRKIIDAILNRVQ